MIKNDGQSILEIGCLDEVLNSNIKDKNYFVEFEKR